MRAASPIAIYRKLREHFGFLNWWPGETKLEIFVGAILTQQTSWKNVEKAIANLKAARCLDFDKIAGMPIKRLESLVRPSGFYRRKARRLQDICRSIKRDCGSLDKLFRLDKDNLRKVLLSHHGIGNETADSIVLYAAEKPVFVIDAYTKRAMHRINPKIKDNISYEELQSHFESSIEPSIRLYKDMHAQFVQLGKTYCKVKPVCAECPLNGVCAHGRKAVSG